MLDEVLNEHLMITKYHSGDKGGQNDYSKSGKI